jgi:hypothetical protein
LWLFEKGYEAADWSKVIGEKLAKQIVKNCAPQGRIVGLDLKIRNRGMKSPPMEGGLKERKPKPGMFFVAFADANAPLGRQTMPLVREQGLQTELVTVHIQPTEIAAIGAIDTDAEHRPYGELLLLGTGKILSARTLVGPDTDPAKAIGRLVRKTRAEAENRCTFGANTANSERKERSTYPRNKRISLDESLPDVDADGKSNILYASDAKIVPMASKGSVPDTVTISGWMVRTPHSRSPQEGFPFNSS